jgi:hypothetical protein
MHGPSATARARADRGAHVLQVGELVGREAVAYEGGVGGAVEELDLPRRAEEEGGVAYDVLKRRVAAWLDDDGDA